MTDKDKDIKEILTHRPNQIFKAILEGMDSWRVAHIRQRLHPTWRDGFHQSLFDLWYTPKDVDSPAREYFTHLKQVMKHYPEQGWGGPASSAEVGLWKCNVCCITVTDDEIMLDHFRNMNCPVFDEWVEYYESPKALWIKMGSMKNK